MFAITNKELRSSYNDVFKSIKKHAKKQSLGYRVLSHQVNNMKKMRKSKLKKHVKSLVKNFKKRTGLKLKYVVVPHDTPAKVVNAFQARKISVVSPTQAKELGKEAGIFYFENKDKKAVKALKKSIKKNSVAVVAMKSCVPTGAKVQAAEVETVKSKKMNAARAQETETAQTDADAEKTDADAAQTDAESKPATPETNTQQQTATGDVKANSASGLTVSSFAAIAVVSAVAALLM